MLLTSEKIYGSHVYKFKNCHGVDYQLVVDTSDSSAEILDIDVVDVSLIPIFGMRNDEKFLFDPTTRRKICETLYNDFILQNKRIRFDFIVDDERANILALKFFRWINPFIVNKDVIYDVELVDDVLRDYTHVKVLIFKH